MHDKFSAHMCTRITSRGTQANVIDSDLDSVHEIYLEYRAIVLLDPIPGLKEARGVRGVGEGFIGRL